MLKSGRRTEIDCMRGMAILMVLLYHSVLVFPVNLHEISWCAHLHRSLWVLQMPLFFLVSGYCYSLGKGYLPYLWKKVKRILVPHVVFSVLDILPRVIDNPLVHERMNLKEALQDFLLYGGSDWFLWVLFVITVFFPWVVRLCRGRVVMVLGGSLVLFVVGQWMPDLFLVDMAAEYMLYFALGWCLRYLAEWGRNTNSANTGESSRLPQLLSGEYQMGLREILLSGMGTLCFLFLYFEFGQRKPLELLTVLCSFPLFYGIAGHLSGMGSRVFAACGKYSLPMYLMDAYALVVTRTVLCSLLGITNPMLLILGNFLPDAFVVYWVSRLIIAPVPLFAFLCGMPVERRAKHAV